MRWVARVLALAIVLAAGAGAAQQAPPAKLALVIGNADYDRDGRIDSSPAATERARAAGKVPDLANPANDATDIAEALMRVGFHVLRGDDLARDDMTAKLAQFSAMVADAPPDAQVVIYYAGHAIQVDGRNFLIPVGASLPAVNFENTTPQAMREMLSQMATPVEALTAIFRRPTEPGVNVLLLDACRSNPWGARFGEKEGLAGISAPPRTVIGFATEPETTATDGAGRNSPYAKALKLAIGRPATVTQMLDAVGDEVQIATGRTQIPWSQSPSIGETCLSTCPPSGDAATRELAAARQRLRALDATDLDEVDRKVVSRYLLNSIGRLANYTGRPEDAFSAELEGYFDIDRAIVFLLKRKADAFKATSTPEEWRELRGMVREYFVVTVSPILIGTKDVQIGDVAITRTSEALSTAHARVTGNMYGGYSISFDVMLEKSGTEAWVLQDYFLNFPGLTRGIGAMTRAANYLETRNPQTLADAKAILRREIAMTRDANEKFEARRAAGARGTP